MALPTVPSSGGIDSIAQLMQSLGPLLGSGKQSTERQTGALPGDIQSTNDLIAQILGSVNGDNLDTLTQNVLTRAKQTFAPANILPNAAGIRGYSDTVKMSLQNEAMARATAEAMQVRLQAQGAAQKTAAGLTETKVQANKSDNTQQKTGANNAGKLLSLALPAATIYNQYQKRKPADAPDQTSGNTTDPVVGAPDNTTTDPNAQVIASDINTNIGGLSSEDTGAILPGASVVPDAIDFTGGALDDQVAANAQAGDVSSATVDAPNAPDIGDSSDFSDFDISDVFDFADGGVVPGRRAPPGSYDSDAMAARSPLIQSPKLALATSSDGAVVQSTAKSKKSLPLSNILQDNSLEGQILQQNDNSEAPAPGPDAGPAPAGLGLGLAGLGQVAGAIGLGPVAGALGLAAQALGINGIVSALSNALSSLDSTEVSGESNSTSLSSQTSNDSLSPGNDATGPDGLGGLAGDTGVTDSAGPAPGPGAASGPGPGDGTSPGPGDDGSGGNADGGNGADGSGGAAAGDGGSGGGDDFDGDPTVKPRNATDMMGIDRVPIHVTPGEAILPIDTVAALGGEDAIDALIAATHTPIRKKANGRR